MDSVSEFARLIKGLVAEGINASQSLEIVPLELISIAPLRFQKSRELILDAQDVIIPKGLYFSKSDIGKTFSFFMAHKGQKYYLLQTRGNG